MAVTKGQLLAWAMIVLLTIWGYTLLSRLTIPKEMVGEAIAASVVEAKPRAIVPAPVVVQPKVPAATIAEAPATPAQPAPEVIQDPVAVIASLPKVGVIEMPLTESTRQILATSIPDLPAFTSADAEPAFAAEPVLVAEPVAAPEPAAVTLAASESTLYVVADMLNIRSAPSTEGAVLQKVRMGFALEPRQQSADWVGFQMKDGSTGWLRTDFLSPQKPQLAEVAEVPVAAAAPLTIEAASSGEPLNLF